MSSSALSYGEKLDVSVVVVHWNTPQLLTRCLGAVAAAMAEFSYETIVIDNGSRGGGRMSVQAGQGLVALYNPTNRGFAVAANQGAGVARAELLLFLNTDVELPTGCLSALVSGLRLRPDLAALAATAINDEGCLRFAGLNFLNPFNHAAELLGVGGLSLLRRSRRGQDCAEAAVQEVDWLRASTLLVRSQAFRAVCGFDEGYLFYEEDEDLCWRLRRRGYRVAEAYSVTVSDPGGLSAARAQEWATLCLYDGQQRFVRRRCGRFALFVYRVCVSLALVVKILLSGRGHLRQYRGSAIAVLKSLWKSKLQSEARAPTSPV